MSQRQFLSTLIWLVIVNLVIKAMFVFGIDLQVQKQVGQEIYGHYFALINLCYIFQIINDFGLNLLHGTDTAHHGYVRRGHWRTIVRLKIFLSLAYTLIVFSIASVLGIVFSWQVMIALVISIILISWISVLRAGISGLAGYNREALISVLDKFFMILICGFLFFRFDVFRIEWFAWAQVFSFGLTVLIAYWIFRSIDQKAGTLKEEDDHKMVITFKDAIPFSLTALLMYAYTRSDAILLTKLIPDGAHEAGIYAAGFRLLDAANMIAILVTPLLIPMYARLHHDKKESGALLHLAAGIIIVMTCTISIAGFFWSRPIMILCYGHDEMQWLTTFRLLILCHIPIGLMYVYGSYLTAHRQLLKQNIWFAIIVMLNIGLNFLLIPRLSTTGASISAIITEFLATLGVIVLAYQHLKNLPNASWLMRSILYVIMLTVAAWMMSTWISNWWMAILLFCLLSLALAFLIRLLNWKKIRQLLGRMETV
jgi:O-antigen/teichoic acid export membrane protein